MKTPHKKHALQEITEKPEISQAFLPDPLPRSPTSYGEPQVNPECPLKQHLLNGTGLNPRFHNNLEAAIVGRGGFEVETPQESNFEGRILCSAFSISRSRFATIPL